MQKVKLEDKLVKLANTITIHIQHQIRTQIHIQNQIRVQIQIQYQIQIQIQNQIAKNQIGGYVAESCQYNH